jgi:hypothetical protein
MPGTIRLGALLALLAAAVALPGCGSDEISGEIPAENVPTLNAALEGVSTTIETDCDQAQAYAQDFVDAVNELPQDPTGEVKTELQSAGDHLRTLVETECPATDTPQTTQDTTDATTTDTADTTTDTATTDATTTTTTDTTTDTTTTDQTQPPDGNDGDGPPNDGGTGGTGGPGTDE